MTAACPSDGADLDIVWTDEVYSRQMASSRRTLVHLEFTSALEMVDFVQLVGDHVTRSMGLDEETVYWISLALRESVINAITHGNRNDSGKRVFVDLETRPRRQGSQLSIRVRDQGDGFDPGELADPLAAENLLKTTGRGILLIRHCMDRVRTQRAPEGGTEIVMVKVIPPPDATRDAAGT
jgi:serine/threonine-protein kinase RsbW